MLVGLTAEERSAMNVQVSHHPFDRVRSVQGAGPSIQRQQVLTSTKMVFADPIPTQHPEYNQTWLDVVDSWSTYNVSDEQFNQIVHWKKADQIQEKATL